jgi:hypothetical protein
MRELTLILILTAVAPASAQAPAANQAGVDAAARESAAAANQLLRGKPVRGAGEVLLGHVEQVTAGPAGRPAQVLVRPKGLSSSGPRSIAFAAVQVTGKGLQTPLTAGEFAAMPPVTRRGE